MNHHQEISLTLFDNTELTFKSYHWYLPLNKLVKNISFIKMIYFIKIGPKHKCTKLAGFVVYSQFNHFLNGPHSHFNLLQSMYMQFNLHDIYLSWHIFNFTSSTLSITNWISNFVFYQNNHFIFVYLFPYLKNFMIDPEYLLNFWEIYKFILFLSVQFI